MKNAPQNLLDKAIAYVAPRVAARRMQARMALALAGGYSGASYGRPGLAGWAPRASDAVADTNYDLPTLRARTRDLARNAPLAAGAISTQVTNVVGTGLSLQPTPDAELLGIDDEAAQEWADSTLREYKLWAETTDCDVTRTQNFYGLQALAFRSALESGDVLSLLPTVTRPGRPYRLALQLIEADRVCNPNFVQDTGQVAGGIELDEWGAPVAYHICRQHPGSLLKRSGFQWDRVTAYGNSSGRRNVIHLFDRRRPGQVRGVPVLAPVIEPLKQLQRYTDAELQAAVISGMFAVFVKMDPEAFQDMFDQDGKNAYLNSAMGWDGTINGSSLDGGGKAINLLPGEEVDSANPGRPNALFDPFVQAIIRQIGVALEMPFEVLVKHFTSSYSAARAALLDAWRFFRGRRDWLASNFCQPIYEAWLEEAVALGRVSAPGFFSDPAIRRAWCASVWVGDGPGSIDPQKEVGAAADRIALGISTRAAESILHDGVDWRVKHKQLVEEEERRREDGLTISAPMPEEPDPAEEKTAEALAGLVGAVAALAAKEPAPITFSPTINAPSSPVTVEGVTVTLPKNEFHAGDTHVSLPEGCISLEAHVDVPPAQVIVAQPKTTIETIERDEAHEIKRIVRTAE